MERVRTGSTFVWVFAIGLLVFVGGGLLAGAGFFDTGTDAETGDLLVQDTDIGQIGDAQPDYRTITLGTNGQVSVGQTETTFIAERVDAFWVSQRPFTGHQRSFSFEAENPRSATVRFEIGATNALANLHVAVNGETVLDNVKTGGSIVELDLSGEQLQSGVNTVTFSADPSYTQFWAETRYLLQDMELTVTDTNRNQVTYPFRVYEYEAENFDTAQISFQVRDAVVTNDLQILVNGNEIYRNQPARSIEGNRYTENFTRFASDLSPGENTVTFQTSGDAAYTLDNTEVTLQYFVARQRQSATTQFTLSQDRFDALATPEERGRLRFTVSSVDTDRGLTVSVGNNTMDIASVQPQTYTRFFDAEHVHQGNNTVSFSTTGSYTVEDVSIDIVADPAAAQ